jgi:hypothetical protein
LVLLALVVANTPKHAQAQPAKGGKKPALTDQPHHRQLSLLDLAIDMKDFQQPMTLKEVVGLLWEKLNAEGKEFTILVDSDAFREENPDDPDIFDIQVRFPPFPRKMTIGTALRLALAKAPSNNATFVVYADRIEITTLKRASVDYKLKQRILATFDNRKLWAVLRELSEMTGTSIVLDNRAGDKEDRLVSASFLNDVTLAGALQAVAEMAELKVVVLKSGVIFVTTPAHAETLRKENALQDDAAAAPVAAGLSVCRRLVVAREP